MTVEGSDQGLSRPGLARTHVAAVLLGSQVCLAGGAFIVNILAARGLGPAGRGELALLLHIAYASNLLCLLGRHRSYLALRTPDHTLGLAHREMSRLARLPIVLAVMLALATAVSFGPSIAVIAALFVGLSLKMSAGVFVNTHRAAAIVGRDASPYFVATVATQVLLIGIATSFLALGIRGVAPWLAAYGLTAAVPYLAAEALVRRRDPRVGPGPTDLSRARRMGLRLVPANLAEAVVRRSDRFLIPALSSFEQLGIYAVVTTMVGVIEWPIRQHADSRTPEWSEKFQAGELAVGREILRGALAAGAMTVAVAGISWLALIPLFGDEYRSGLQLILPLGIAHACSAVAVLGTSMAVAVERPRFASYINLSGLICSIPAYVVLIRPYGAAGAAWGFALGYAVSAGVTTIVYAAFLQRSANRPVAAR